MASTADPADARRLTRRGTLIALGLAVAAVVWLAVWPCFYVGQTASGLGGGRPERVCATLIGQNGLWVAWLLAIPVALAAIGWVGALVGRGGVIWAVGFASLGFSILAMWSIGVFSLPSAIALLVTAGIARRRYRRGPAVAPAVSD